MKLSVPAATIVAMAFYSKSAAAFSISKQQLGRHAAKIIGATAYLSNTPFQVSAAKKNTPIRSFSKSTSLNMADKAPFKTWTFDKACDTMDFTELSSASIYITDDLATTDDSDLIMFGIYGPEKKEDEDDESENKEEGKEVSEPTLIGKAKEIDELFEGALTDLMMENYKEFKHGAALGKVTPVLRIFSGAKVSKHISCTDRNIMTHSITLLKFHRWMSPYQRLRELCSLDLEMLGKTWKMDFFQRLDLRSLLSVMPIRKCPPVPSFFPPHSPSTMRPLPICHLISIQHFMPITDIEPVTRLILKLKT
jgi:hypothetical protein